MKKLTILSTLVILLALYSKAQEQTSGIQKFYFQAGAGGGAHDAVFGELSLHAVLKKNWMIGLSYQSTTMNPKNLPSNYEPGYTIVFFFPIPDPMPTVNMNLVSLTA